MAKKKTARKTEVHLTEKALRDIAAIRRYSVKEFGKRVATKYVDALQAAFTLIKEQPGLLRVEQGFHDQLRFYRVEKHLLVCDVQRSDIFVLTVLSTSQDVAARLADLQPTIALETELLHRKLQQARRKRKD